MCYYVIRRDDGAFVSAPGTGAGHSYTRKLQEAQVYTTRGQPMREKCENETVIHILDAFDNPAL